jgi:hypothetical protein
MTGRTKYTCHEYREEMTLLGLKKRLNSPGLSDDERQEIKEEIRRLEATIGMD